MKTIKIKFTGFWKNFNANDNFILDILKKNYEVVLSETPEYLFYSVFNDDYIKYDCVRIFDDRGEHLPWIFKCAIMRLDLNEWSLKIAI